MRFVVAVVLLFGLVQADFFDSGEDDQPEQDFDLEKRYYLDAKKPCCFPSKFESFIGERIEYMTGKKDELNDNDIDKRHPRPHPRPHHVTRMGILGRMAVDSDAKKVGMRMHVMQFPHPRNMTIVIDYNKKAMYIADPDKQKCHKVAFDQPMQAMCIPDNSTYAGTFRWGSGDNSVEVDAWKSHVAQRKPVRTMMRAEVLVASGSCVPISERGGGVAGRTRIGFEATFVNLNTTISDPGIFTPPSYCDSAEIIDIRQADPTVLSFVSRFNKN
jgi:hypothetical protein